MNLASSRFLDGYPAEGFTVRIGRAIYQLKMSAIFIKGDVLDFPRLTDAFKKQGREIDGILHTEMKKEFRSTPGG